MSDQIALPQRIAWSLLIVVIVGLIGASLWKRSGPAVGGSSGDLAAPGINVGKESVPKDHVFGDVHDFSLSDQHGNKQTLQNFKGFVWVADFVFTRCAGNCLLMTESMIALERELSGESGLVKFVSVSVDPNYDTAEVLQKYARVRGADKPNWFFLTGSKSEIYRIMHDDFKLPIAENSGSTDEPITHSAKLALIDRRGRIRGYYSGMEAETMKDVAAEVLKLLREKE